MSSFENLKLLESEEKPVPLSMYKRQLIVTWLDKYKEAFGKKYSEPFVKCLGTLKGNFEAVDEDTGEILIEYPTIEEWTEEIEKFLIKSPQNWFRANGKCTFYLFCKHYGRFDHHVNPEKKQPAKTATGYYCKGCNKTHPFDQYCEKS